MTRTRSRRSLTALVALSALTALAAPAARAATVAPAGSATELVYAADRGSSTAIVITDLETRRSVTVRPAGVSLQFRYFRAPELSPDGSRIVTVQDYEGEGGYTTSVVVMNRDGSGFRQLTTPRSSSASGGTYDRDVDPTWAPDGRTILFSRATLRQTPDFTAPVSTALHTVPAAGGVAAALPGGAGGFTADYSPDGTQIVFGLDRARTNADRFPVPDLAVVRTDGTGSRRLLGGQGQDPAWSPDGTTIAYSTRTERDPRGPSDFPDDVFQIALVPASGGVQRVLAPTRPSSARTVARAPSWTPDSGSVLFSLVIPADPTDKSEDVSGKQIWAVDRDGGRAGQVIPGGGVFDAALRGPLPQPVAPGTPGRFTPLAPVRVLDTRDGTGAPRAPLGPGGRLELDLSARVPADATAAVLNVTATNPSASTDVRVFPTGTAVPGASSLNTRPGQTVPNLVSVALGSASRVSLFNAAGRVDLVADLAGYYAPGAGSGFTSLPPARVLDSRSGLGAPKGRLNAGGSLDLKVTGTLTTADGSTAQVPADATAVVLNLTGTDVNDSTDLRAYPTPGDDSVPVVSNLNLTAGQTAANLVTVAVGAGGTVRLRNNAGQAAVVADLAGFYSPSSTGRFVPVSPSRLLDTRTGLGAAPLPIPGGRFVDLAVSGSRGVPAGASAAVLNLTATGVTRSTDVRAYPAGAGSVPTVSNLNVTTGQTRANAAIVRTGTDGAVRLRNNTGELFLIGDLSGYFID